MKQADVDQALDNTFLGKDQAAQVVYDFLTALIDRANWWERIILKMVRDMVAKRMGFNAAA
jgi:hypothetical protein